MKKNGSFKVLAVEVVGRLTLGLVPYCTTFVISYLLTQVIRHLVRSSNINYICLSLLEFIFKDLIQKNVV